MIRENAEQWHVDPHKIALCVFSAGGHLVAMQGVHWNDPEIMSFCSKIGAQLYTVRDCCKTAARIERHFAKSKSGGTK